MRSKYQKTLLFLLFFLFKFSNSKPISVPVDNNYSYNNYDDAHSRHPNSFYNRLPPNSNQVQVDEVADASNNDYDYDDQQTDKPVISSSNQQQSNYNHLFNNNFLLTENRIKHKKKRRIRRPCIPIQSFGSPLFSNRLKRQTSSAEDGKTLGLLFGGGGYPGYYAPPGGYYGNPGYQDNVKPQYDPQSSGQTQYGQPLYQPYGGYPCIPVSYGHRPGLGGGLFGNRPGLLGGGGGGLFGGPGILGQGGLLDFGSPGPLAPAGVYQGAGSYPQTVIINRPPLFGNLPSYNRPGGGNYGSENYGSNGYPSDSTSGGQNQPFWGSVVDKLQEFVTGINPQQVFSTIGDSLQGIAQSIQNASPAAAAADTIRQGYREFSSLLFR